MNDSKGRNRLEDVKSCVTNHPLGAIAALLFTAVIALSTFTGALQHLREMINKLSPKRPLAHVSVKQKDNGTAVIRFRFFDIPEGKNVDRITLAIRQTKPEFGVEGNPSERVEPLRLDAEVLTPAMLDEDNPKLEIDARLLETPGEPYLLAELPLYWQRPDTSVGVEITPTFSDARGKLIPFTVKPASVNVQLTNYSTVEYSDEGQRSEALEAAIAAAQQANSLQELQEASNEARFQNSFVREGLWYVAAFASWPDQFQVDTELQEQILKTFVLATLLELAAKDEVWPEREPLFALGPTSLEALHEFTGLAPTGSARRAFFSRMPEFRKDSRHGFLYQYLRFDDHQMRQRVVLERSDLPFADLDSEYTARTERLPYKDSAHPLPIEARSYSFPLGALNHFVIAAKAYAYLHLLRPELPDAKYANLIIANAFYATSLLEGNGHSAVNLSRTAIHPLKDAIEGLRYASASFGRLLGAEVLEPRLTAVNFFGRRLQAAEKRYVRAARQEDRENAYRLYGHWGSAMTAVGLGNREAAASHMKAVLTGVSDDAPADARYRYLLVAMLDTFDKSSVVGKALSSESKRIERWRSSPVDEDIRFAMNMDFGRVLWTIGRFREAASFFMREIDQLPAGHDLERRYLNELGAFLSDTFTLLSWEMSFEEEREGDFIPRTKNTPVWLEDFAPTWIDRLFDRGGGRPYGAVTPEEDRATCLEAYDASIGHPRVASVVGRLLKQPVSSVFEQSLAPGGQLVSWAREQRQNHNYEPLLKLAWVEWFRLPFVHLAQPDFELSHWRYEPLEIDKVATQDAVREIAGLPAGESDLTTRQVAETFLEVRGFLESRYGK